MADSFKQKRPNPTIDKNLVEWLERIFPNGWQDPAKATTEALWFSQGQQKVVAKIRLEYERQQTAASVIPNTTFQR